MFGLFKEKIFLIFLNISYTLKKYVLRKFIFEKKQCICLSFFFSKNIDKFKFVLNDSNNID